MFLSSNIRNRNHLKSMRATKKYNSEIAAKEEEIVELIGSERETKNEIGELKFWRKSNRKR